MTRAWVIGRGGLLGSALERLLPQSGTSLFAVADRLAWDRPERLHGQIRDELGRFATSVEPGVRWEIYWAAGIGTMSSAEAALVTETDALSSLCDALGTSTLDPRHGRLALASSASAIFAGSPDAVISERSDERPTTAYARAKLEQEQIVRSHASRSGTATLIARISTLYGVGQANEKQQGLLTHISRCLIRNEPIRIFVPLDTIRDYICADDAAAMTVDVLRIVAPSSVVSKIVASEQPATISEIVSIFKRLARRPPRIVTGSTSSSGIYTRRIQFRSIVPPLRARLPTQLMIGISRVLAAERQRYVAPARPPIRDGL